jgi:hypothetical protein
MILHTSLGLPCISGITCVAVLGKEELLQEPIDPQETFAVESQAAVAEVKKSLVLQPMQALSKSLLWVYSELGLKVVSADVAKFHLQDELPNHALFMSGSKGPVDREGSVAKLREVGFPVMLILEVSASNMRK